MDFSASSMIDQPPFTVTWKSLLQVLAFSLAFVALLKQFSPKRRLKLPPGPTPWPIVGNLLQLGPVPHKTIASLTETYGPIVFLKLGSRPALIASDPDIINDIMKTQDLVFSSRPQTICAKHLTYNLHDFILAPYGDHWRAMRRICVTHLLSPKRLESFGATRDEEANAMVESVGVLARAGKEVEVRPRIESFAMNVITDMILGKKFFGTEAAGKEENERVLELLVESFRLFGDLNVGDFIPWLAFLDLQGYQRKMKKMHKELDERLQVIIEEHREARKQGSGGDEKRRRQDFVDVLLDLPGENGEEHLDDITIKALVLDMMWSAIDVPVNIAEWAMAELVCHPEIQKKLQAEIDDAVSPGRAVQESDIPNLPYLRCIIKEVFRLHPAGPFGVPRMNLAPAKVRGYDIPAFSTVMVSNTQLALNSALWPSHLDAARFLPERWDPAEPLQDPRLRVNPFGVGRRSCAGAALGAALVTLSVATLAQRFWWGPGGGVQIEDVDMNAAVTGLMPMRVPLKAVAAPREMRTPRCP